MGGISKFTAEELAELRAFDARIDREPDGRHYANPEFTKDAERFRLARRATGLTQEAAGKLFGVCARNMSAMENGYRELPENIKKWLEAAEKKHEQGVSRRWTRQQRGRRKGSWSCFRPNEARTGRRKA